MDEFIKLAQQFQYLHSKTEIDAINMINKFENKEHRNTLNEVLLRAKKGNITPEEVVKILETIK